MTISTKALSAKTTCSKWQKGDTRRVYLNSPILQHYGVEIFFECGYNGYCVPRQIGKMSDEHKILVMERFWQHLVEKGIANKERLYLDFEMFDTFWNKL
jgi:hypothetical protein